MNTKAAIRSLRLRTLPLSTGGVLLGILLAWVAVLPQFWTALLILLTTICLQIVSNLSNELGDVLHGTDTAERQGPAYGLNGGELTVADMKKLIVTFVVLSIVFGTAMTWVAFGTLLSWKALGVLLLGACAIAAALCYTLGSHPYGYRGLGDLFVFIFFGLVAVLGAMFICYGGQNLFFAKDLLPAAGVGFFSVGVLNVNNTRDMRTDAATRTTVALKLGLHGARVYQTVLIVLGWVCMISYCLLCWGSVWHWVWVLTIPLYIKHLRIFWTCEGHGLDRALPLLVNATFLLCLLMGLGFLSFQLF